MAGIAQKILGSPEKYSVQELTQGVQNGTIPGYIGIPLIQDKMKKQKEAQAISGAPQGPQIPIAEQVLAQAQGVSSLQSNLPEQMAGGGIVAFAGGGSSARALLDDEDDDYTDAVMGAMDSMDAMRSRMNALRDSGISPSESSGLAALLPPHLGGTNDQSMQVAYNGPGAGIVESVRSYFNKGQENTAPQAAPAAPSPTPKTGTPSKFVDAYLPLAEKVGDRLGVAPKLLLAQWGNETGWGKSVIPGTNNLGNIMDFSGKGPKAVDNYNGRVDSYRAYKNPDEFGNDFAGVIERVHKGALNSGEDASRYFGSLKKSGYAEHPKYVDSGIKATKMVERELANRKEANVAAMAAGGVAHFDGGGISDIYNMTADQIKDFMNRRLRMEQARAAFSAAPEAAAAEGIKGLSPAANQARPSMGSAIARALSGITGPLAATTAAGAVPTALAGNYLNRLPTESLDTLSGDIGSDTGLAAAIMSQGRQTPQAPQVAPAARPVAPPMAPSGAGGGRGQQGGPTAEQMRRAAFERNIGNTQDMEDMDAGINALSAAQASPVTQPTAEAAPAEDTMTALRKQISESLSGLKSQAEQDKYLSLLQAGLGMLGGTSPFAAANIGQGAMQGVNTYAALGRQRGDEQKSLLSAQLGLERYGQLGALTKEQMALRKELAAQEDLRKRELAGAAIDEKAARRGVSEEKMYADRLAQMEKLAQNEALAKFKGAILPEEKERIFAQALTGLRSDPAYRKLYSRVHGMDPGTLKIRDYVDGQLK